MQSDRQPSAEEALEFAHHLADQARLLALQYFRSTLEILRKADGSTVTVADRIIEGKLRQLIRDRFSHHGIIGEEYGNTSGERSWVLDPIDGTANFILGNPLFGTLIGLLQADQPFVGLIDVPAMRERWAGDGKRTVYYDGSSHCTVEAGACETLDRARLYIELPDFLRAGKADKLGTLSKQAAVSHSSCDCYAYGLLASGHCDLVIEDGLDSYDFLPIVPVVRGASGWMTDWEGNSLTLNSDGRVIAAATLEF